MGMGKVKEQTVCIAVAYKIDYCIKKALQFEETDANVVFTHINKVKIGQKLLCHHVSASRPLQGDKVIDQH